MQEIPITTDAHQIFKVVLNNQQITIELRWQDVSNSWFISLYDSASNNPYLINRRLKGNVLLFNHFLNDFTGDIIAYSTAYPNNNIARDDFNSIYKLYYLTSEEVSELKDS